MCYLSIQLTITVTVLSVTVNESFTVYLLETQFQYTVESDMMGFVWN